MKHIRILTKMSHVRRWLSSVGDLFDWEFYLANNPDVAAKHSDRLSAAGHFLRHGWKEGRDPNPGFSTNHYLETSPDIAKAGLDPLLHYALHGRREGRLTLSDIRREISKFFDMDYYAAQAGDLGTLSPVDHYVLTGWKSGCDPNPDFSTRDYLRMNGDVKRSGLNALYHYAIAGEREGRVPKQRYDRRISASAASPAILFIGHSARKTGAEVMLLDYLKWVGNHTSYQVDLILLSPGILVTEYQKYARVLCLDYSGKDIDPSMVEDIREFIRRDYRYIYMNTVASLPFLDYAESLGIALPPTVLHVHELSGVLDQFSTGLKSHRDKIDLVIAASNIVSETIVRRFGILADRVRTHHSFVSTPPQGAILPRSVARAEFGIPEDAFVILGAGTVDERKGPDLFVDTIERVSRELAPRRVKALWFGDGPLLNKILDEVSRRGLRETIEFLGFRNDASRYFSLGDVFFLSSREDPFPLVCLEAALCSVPIVFFHEAGGIGEFVGDDAGVGVPGFSVEGAASALSTLLRNESLRWGAGALARARVVTNYTTPVCAPRLFHEVRNSFAIPPSVSVLVVTYNHETFINNRIDSILGQSFQDFEILLIDDASQDATFERAKTQLKSDPRTRFVVNEKNSGSPFSQWAKGIGIADGDRIWIAEGDDSCSSNFLETLVPALDRANVGIAYCSSTVMDENYVVHPFALRDYLRRASGEKFEYDYDRSGPDEVEESIGPICTIPNASAALFRKAALLNALPGSERYKMCGDWAIYLKLLESWGIAYRTGAVNYFRRHRQSVVHRIEGTDQYFRERGAIVRQVLQNFAPTPNCIDRMRVEIEQEWHRFRHVEKSLALGEVVEAFKHPATPWRRRLRIGFYVHGYLFSVGGIERVASLLAQALTRRGHAVYIFCRVWGPKARSHFSSDGITIVPAFNEDVPDSTMTLRAELVRARLDLFMPMLSEWLFEPIIAAASNLSFPVVASEHNDPWMIERLWWSKQSRVQTFKKVDGVHLLLEKFRSSLPESFHEKIFVIPNGINVPSAETHRHVDRSRQIIAVGRLVPQKRYDRLLKAFSRVVKSVGHDTDWRLAIYGEGPELESLTELAKTLKIARQVHFNGVTDSISSRMSESAFLVISSDFEGFGIVIVEAKCAGIPSVGYTNCNGPSDLIAHEHDGLLAQPDDDGSELAKCMLRLIEDDAFREKLGFAARRNAEAFDIERLVHVWEDQFYGLLGERLPAAAP